MAEKELGFWSKFKEKFKESLLGRKKPTSKSGGGIKYFYSKKLDTSKTKLLNRAIKDNSSGKLSDVVINYTKADGTKAKRKVRPITAKKTKKGYLVLAHDYMRDDIRSFRVDRLGSIKTADVNFEYRQRAPRVRKLVKDSKKIKRMRKMIHKNEAMVKKALSVGLMQRASTKAGQKGLELLQKASKSSDPKEIMNLGHKATKKINQKAKFLKGVEKKTPKKIDYPTVSKEVQDLQQQAAARLKAKGMSADEALDEVMSIDNPFELKKILGIGGGKQKASNAWSGTPAVVGMKKASSAFWSGFDKKAGFLGLSEADRQAVREIKDVMKEFKKGGIDVNIKVDPAVHKELGKNIDKAVKGGNQVLGETLQETMEKSLKNIKSLKSKNLIVPSIVAGAGLGLGALIARLAEKPLDKKMMDSAMTNHPYYRVT